MQPTKVIAIFDVGKTNKKLFLFDQDYRIVFEKAARFNEIKDEDGEDCENLQSLQTSVFDSLKEVMAMKDLCISAVNFTAYGASLVYLDKEGNVLTPLYNYLKSYPAELLEKFYDSYGGSEEFSKRTASPVLGSLNSGMQIYRIKYERPELFNKIQTILHLPQFLSFLVTNVAASDITSIGCHTNLWDFTNNHYHQWVTEESVIAKLAPILQTEQVFPSKIPGHDYKVGIGLHDSSAALIPYLLSFQEPFVLISTGTWCITMNPFNHSPLSKEELESDCLNYMTFQGKALKSSRLFAGQMHESALDQITAHFNTSAAKYRNMAYNQEIIESLIVQQTDSRQFSDINLNEFETDEIAYHHLMLDIIKKQYRSTMLVLQKGLIKRIFVDGGFSRNAVYMNLLAAVFPEIEIYAASMAQATAVGAAMAIHSSWNVHPYPNNIIELKYYAARNGLTV